MKFFIIVLANIIFFLPFLLFAQYPDTIIIKTERIKGYGPFERSTSLIQPLLEDNPWNKAIPDYAGIPDTLEYLMFTTEQTDFRQYTYQSYYNNKIDDEFFESCKSSWNWNPSSSEYSKDHIKVNIGVVAGYDSLGELKIKVDKNNNYDFSDDEYFTLPEKLPGQNWWGRYSDLSPVEVSYEYYDGSSIKTAKTWIYMDYFISMYNSTQEKPNPIVLTFGLAEHHLGDFSINGIKYYAAVGSDRATFRDNYKIKLWNENDNIDSISSQADISRNGFVKIEDNYYRFNFVSKAISGNIIELDKLKGKYVYLDFWGTWCSPCREEIPILKSIYSEYQNKNFALIGIVNDNFEALQDFVKKQEINWEQILQSEDKSIIADYGVTGYPTTFFIDPEGKIISKNIRAVELSESLQKYLGKNKLYSSIKFFFGNVI